MHCTDVAVKLTFVQELTCVMESPNKITLGQITELNLDMVKTVVVS